MMAKRLSYEAREAMVSLAGACFWFWDGFCGEKDGRVSYWLQPSAYDTDAFRGAWNRIGRGDDAA